MFCFLSDLYTAMSANYVVFIEQPIKMNVWKILTAKLTGKSIGDAIYWEPKLETIFHLIDKQTGQVSRQISRKGQCDWRKRAEILFPCLTYKDSLRWANRMVFLLSIPVGQFGKVPHQSHGHLPPDQCLWAGRLSHAGSVCVRWRPGHQHLQPSEHAQVRGGFGSGIKLPLLSSFVICIQVQCTIISDSRIPSNLFSALS